MGGLNMIIIVLLVVLVIAGLVFASVYNRLVVLRNRCENGWAQVDVQLKKRADLVPNLVETVKGYAAHEKGVFEAVTKARASIMNAGSVADMQTAQNGLTSALKSSADAFFTYSLNKDTSRPVILVLPDNDSALRVYYDLQTFIEEGVFIFPAVEELEGVRLPASNEITEQRITGIKELLHGKFKAAVLLFLLFSAL